MTTRSIPLRFLLALGSAALLASACSGSQPLAPTPGQQGAATTLTSSASSGQAGARATANDRACWGQATQVFARMGLMGAHASQFPTPRLGLRNLARALYEQGVIPDDSMQALGAFVAAELKLSIRACM
jgi:hypothetical protein